jgi:hypothetical protein
MGKLNRRDFLKAAATGAGALTLGALLDACGQALPTPEPAVPTQAPVLESSPTAEPPAVRNRLRICPILS